jgi:type II secretory pathway predicted ATPase ExeA
VLKTCAEGKRTIVVVDEAHHLNADLLEELRLLGNLEAGADKAFQVVCLAQSAILETLKHSLLAAWKQRMAVHAHLGPISVEEACDYLLHYLRMAGGKPEKIFDESGLETLARGTRGIPRLISQAAQQALVFADAAEMEIVDAEAALEALAVMGLQTEDTTVNELDGAEENATSFRLTGEIRKTA